MVKNTDQILMRQFEDHDDSDVFIDFEYDQDFENESGHFSASDLEYD